MRSTTRVVTVVAVALGMLVTACGGGDAATGSQKYVALDGSPRHPDAEGVLTRVAEDFRTLEVDGKRYDVAKDLQCFATQDGSTLPLRQRVGSYVQVGLHGDTVVWLANIANVVRRPGARDVVYYVGDVVDRSGGSLVFKDGTVLRIASSLKLADPPKGGVIVSASIDPKQHAVIELRAT